MATNREWLSIADLSDKDVVCSSGEIRFKDDAFTHDETGGNAPVAGATPATVPANPSDNAIVIEVYDDLIRYWLYDAATTTWSVTVEAALGGQVNTASNVGTDGVGVFKQKTGVDLEFRNIAPADAKVTVVLNGDDIDIGIGTLNFADLSDVTATSVQGNIAYFNGVSWTQLPIGAAGNMIIVNDTATAPEYIDSSTPLDCAALGTH